MILLFVSVSHHQVYPPKGGETALNLAQATSGSTALNLSQAMGGSTALNLQPPTNGESGPLTGV